MIARAAFSSLPGATTGKRLFRHAPYGVVFAISFTNPANAQLAATAGIDSDYRFRGYSLSDDHPVASAQLSYDDPVASIPACRD